MTNEHEAQTAAAYDRMADRYAEIFASPGIEQPVDLAMIDHFVALLTEPRRVLDAGCGAGRMLPHLAARGCQVEGIDLAPEMVRRARQDHPVFRIEQGSLTELDLPAESFDGVFCWYSTVHNPDADLPVILSNVHRVLRPGGLVLIGFQVGSGRHEVGGFYRGQGVEVELYRYSRSVQQWCDLLEAQRFEVVSRFDREAIGAENSAHGVVIARAGAR